MEETRMWDLWKTTTSKTKKQMEGNVEVDIGKKSQLFYQLMHYLLDIQNVKIYIKVLYSRFYMFRSPMTIIMELFTEPG